MEHTSVARRVVTPDYTFAAELEQILALLDDETVT